MMSVADIMSKVGCSAHQGDIMSTLGDTKMHVVVIMSTLGGYHEYTGGLPSVHRWVFSTPEGYYKYMGA